jgi:3-methyladenine DNA glycosylase AlkD
MTAAQILSRLREMANPRAAELAQRFFKTGPGEYGEGDLFLGIRVPVIRTLVREFRGLTSLSETEKLLASYLHEARLLALFLLVDRFENGDETEQKKIYDLYLSHTDRINNWDLVDCSAPQIVGGWLASRSHAPLYKLAKSKALWERRIAILATFYFIRRNDLADTFALSELLLRDKHDLMHKACGWMLREAGKRDEAALVNFLERHAATMPRTMLRYAIEKFDAAHRRHFLTLEKPAP